MNKYSAHTKAIHPTPLHKDQGEDIIMPAEPKIPSIDESEIGKRFYTYNPKEPSEESKIETVPAGPLNARKQIMKEIEEKVLDEDILAELKDDMSADDLLKVCSAFYDLATR